MIGLSLENDRNNNVSGQLKHRRSHKFVERLQGRFFVAGVSGSFQKYTKLVAEINANKDEKLDDKKVSEPYLVRKQRLELANDAKRLLEIEEKLEEIKRRKELRKKRDDSRRKNKMETLGAITIQRAIKRYIRRKKAKAVAMILDALRYSAAKQAISAMVWAIKILRRFFKKTIAKFREHRMLLEEIHFAAQDCWLIVSEVACVWTASRRQVADEVVFSSIKTAVNSIASLAVLKKKKPLLQRQGTKKKIHRQKTAKDSNSLQFFLTECENQNGQRSSDDESSESGSYHRSPIKMLQKQKSARSHALLEPTPHVSSSTKHSASTSALPTTKEAVHHVHHTVKPQPVKEVPMKAKDEHVKPTRRKTFDENDAKLAKLKELHQIKMTQMELEKQQRMVNITENKVKKEQEIQAIQQKLKADKEHQDKVKSDFIEKLENERNIKRTAFKASYQIKQREEKLQNEEIALMTFEDRLSRLTRQLLKQAQKPPAPAPKPIEKKPVPKPKPVVVEPVLAPPPPKKPYVPRQVISAAKLAEAAKAKEEISKEELELIEFKRLRDEKFNSEEAIKRNREAVKRRVAAKLARAAQAEKEKEIAEAEVKAKLDQVANESKKHLQHVLTREQALKKFVKSKMKPKKGKKSKKSDFGATHDILNSEDESDEEQRKQEYMRIISSAKEDFEVGEGDFEIEDFFDQATLQQVYVAPSLHEMAQGVPPSVVNKPPSPVAVVVSKKILPAVPNVSVAPGKPKVKSTLNIPKFLRNTPYFTDYEKHVDVPDLKPEPKPRKNTPPYNANAHVGEDDINFVKKSNGKVASLIETISESRKANQETIPPPLDPIEIKGLSDLQIPATLGSKSKKTLDSVKAAPLSFKMAPPSIPIPAMSERDLELLRSVKKRPAEKIATGSQKASSVAVKPVANKSSLKGKTVSESESESEDDADEEMKLLSDYATLKQRLTESFNAENDAKGMSHENIPLDDSSLPRRIELTEELLMNSFGEQNKDLDERSDFDDDEHEDDEEEQEGFNELDEEVNQNNEDDENDVENVKPEVKLDDDDCLQLLQSLTAKINK